MYLFWLVHYPVDDEAIDHIAAVWSDAGRFTSLLELSGTVTPLSTSTLCLCDPWVCGGRVDQAACLYDPWVWGDVQAACLCHPWV